MSPRGKRVTASQVGQYTYCAHAWWLAVIEKCKPTDLAALDAGTKVHERHGWQVSLARKSKRLALGLFCSALLFLVVWAIATYVR
jgi:hypothetical protein